MLVITVSVAKSYKDGQRMGCDQNQTYLDILSLIKRIRVILGN